jgi:uncharacterized circularly permuted ATP-grasp superfamily protein/uncharacterized alpha-E superfamily protein
LLSSPENMQPPLTMPKGQEPSLINSYQPPVGRWDEMVGHGDGIRPAWAGLAATLNELGSEEIRRRKQSIAEQLRLNGVTYHVYGDSRGADRLWSLDPVPMLLESAEWEGVERGLIQRAELLDLILRDIYSNRNLVKEGLIPALFLFSHPGFQRACSGNLSTQKRMLNFYSADLSRGADGSFRVVSDRAQNPSGYGYALENRAVLSRSMPSLFRTTGAHRLDAFFQAFRRGLVQSAPPGVRDPFIVLLSPGPENETFFEQAYLASYLGIPLIRGGDLTAKDGGIHLQSLEGHRKVDVILRRVDDSFCDPLELNGSSLLGVPGLLQAVRNRNVTVCNALGSGILGGSGLMSFLPAICRHYFGQDLLLPSAPTYWCGDKSQRDMALDKFEEMVIKPLYQGASRSTWFVKNLNFEQKEKLLARIRAKPQLYLAQEQMQLGTAPCFLTDRLEARPLVVRSFLASVDDSYWVMPGALTRVAPRADSTEVTGQGGGISKDTWILTSEPIRWSNKSESSLDSELSRDPKILAGQNLPLRLNRQQGPLPGFAAENLFWMGRYQERLECQIRAWRDMLGHLGDSRILSQKEKTDWLHLIQIFQPEFQILSPDPDQIENDLKFSLVDEELLGSPAFNKAALRRAARGVRDLLPDDCWLAIHALMLAPNLEEPLTGPQPEANSFEAGLALLRLDHEILMLAGLAGLEKESISVGPVRRFILLGRCLERALCTVRMLNAGLSRNLNPSEPLLNALLAFHDSELIYRQRYQREIQVGALADLLIADELNPRSIAHQLARFAEELNHLPLGGSLTLSTCQKTMLKALTSVRVFEAGNQGGLSSPSENEGFEHLMGNLETWLNQVSELLAKEFFQPTAAPQSMREWT